MGERSRTLPCLAWTRFSGAGIQPAPHVPTCRAIKVVSVRVGLIPRMNPWVGAGIVATVGVSLGLQIMLLAFGVLSGLSELATVLTLGAIEMTLMLGLVLWLQCDLNAYWGKVKNSGSQQSPVGICELVTILPDLFFWVDSKIELVGRLPKPDPAWCKACSILPTSYKALHCFDALRSKGSQHHDDPRRQLPERQQPKRCQA